MGGVIEEGLLAFVNVSSGRVHLAVELPRATTGAAPLHTFCGLPARGSALVEADRETVLEEEPGRALCGMCARSYARELPAHWAQVEAERKRVGPLERNLVEIRRELVDLHDRLHQLGVRDHVIDALLDVVSKQLDELAQREPRTDP